VLEAWHSLVPAATGDPSEYPNPATYGQGRITLRTAKTQRWATHRNTTATAGEWARHVGLAIAGVHACMKEDTRTPHAGRE
jgi:hypothetical protein